MSRFTRRVTGLLFALLLTVALAACGEATPVPTATPTPTATPVPTPTPVPAAVVVLGDISLPSPDPDRLAKLTHLLSVVPSGYSTAIFMDVQALESNPALKETLSLESLGLAGMLPSAATSFVSRLVLATGEGGQGAFTVLEGSFDVEALLDVASGFGISIGSPEPETYRDHRVWSMDVFGLTLAVGEADDSTVVFASGSPLGGAPAVELVKGALDVFDGLQPSLLDEPGIRGLVDQLPSGFAATVIRHCSDLGELSAVIDLPGCAGGAVSAGLQADQTVVFYGLAGFEDESLAAAALETALERIEGGVDLSFGELALDQKGSLVLAKVLVDPDQVAQAARSLTMPKQ
jgi:hypothetical protein